MKHNVRLKPALDLARAGPERVEGPDATGESAAAGESTATAASAAAMRLGSHDGPRPWYLDVTPLATLPWLIRLRLATVVVEVVTAFMAASLPRADAPLGHIALLILVSAAANATVASSLYRGRAMPSALAAVASAIDMVLITQLLELTGGPLNPFAVVYLVHVALAALTLGALWAGGLALVAVAGFSVLVYWHAGELVTSHHRLNDIPTHLFTFWMAAAVTTELVAHFVVKVSDALARREHELEAMRTKSSQTERLMSLTTLAAGAAHELSTPLATIALASRELSLALDGRTGVTELAADAALIRSEVDRCRAILDQMSGRAGGGAADDPEIVHPADIVADVRARLPPDRSARLEMRPLNGIAPVVIPRAGCTQAILSLVKNAFDATADLRAPVVLEVTCAANRLRFTVLDRGDGFTPEALQRAGEPFYTTKEPGRGLGLGLFLARVFAERLGGALTVQAGNGTAVALELPLVPAPPPVAHPR